VPAAVLYGLAVHWRLYPIIFALPLLRHYALQRQQQQAAACGSNGSAGHRANGSGSGSGSSSLAAAAGALLSPAGVAFGALSGGLFLCLAALFYHLYGHEFLHETYLYHAGRTDPRHNFSPYFYPAYLASSGQGRSWDVGW